MPRPRRPQGNPDEPEKIRLNKGLMCGIRADWEEIALAPAPTAAVGTFLTSQRSCLLWRREESCRSSICSSRLWCPGSWHTIRIAGNSVAMANDRKLNSVDADITIDLSYDGCREEFTQTEERQQFYDTAFAEHPFVEMYYEDLVADRRGEMARVLKLLNLESYELQSPLGKQSTRTLKDILANFVELRQRLAGTPYADFCTDPAP